MRKIPDNIIELAVSVNDKKSLGRYVNAMFGDFLHTDMSKSEIVEIVIGLKLQAEFFKVLSRGLYLEETPFMLATKSLATVEDCIQEWHRYNRIEVAQDEEVFSGKPN